MIDVEYLALGRGWVLIPLFPGTKRPKIQWGQYRVEPPTLKAQKRLLGLSNEFSVLCGPHSGISVLDLDLPLNPDVAEQVEIDDYVTTPSGGRHYYYDYHPGDTHGTGVQPQVDLPYLVKLYDTPEVNPKRRPVQAAPSFTYHTARPENRPVTMDGLNRCLFIQWFQSKRNDPSWASRYPAALAYVSAVRHAIDATPDDLSLGPNYRHSQRLYQSPPNFTHSCMTISRQYRCPNMNYDGQCSLAAAHSPVELAVRLEHIRGHKHAI